MTAAQRHLVTGANGQDGALSRRAPALRRPRGARDVPLASMDSTCCVPSTRRRSAMSADLARRCRDPRTRSHDPSHSPLQPRRTTPRSHDPGTIRRRPPTCSVSDRCGSSRQPGGRPRRGESVRVLQASSAEIFGDATEVPQREDTPRRPVTPYGAAKAFAHQMAGIYRARGLHVEHGDPLQPRVAAASGDLRRSQDRRGRSRGFPVGRQQESSARQHRRASRLGLCPRLRRCDDPHRRAGRGERLRSSRRANRTPCGSSSRWRSSTWASPSGERIVIDPALYRPADPQQLVGDPARLRAIGWAPSVSFEELVHELVDAELALLDRG